MTFNVLAGFLILFLLYQLGEANGQGLLKFPGKPYSVFGLFLLVIPAAHWVARWQGDTGLAAYGMGFHAGWWKAYLLGMGLGLTVQIPLEWLGVRLGIRQVANLRFTWLGLAGGILWAAFANFPAAAGEDLLTRGYLWRFMQESPLWVFVTFSAAVYTLNHLIRLLTRPITDWYHLPFLGVTLAYALYQTGSLWFVIGLHQSGNVLIAVMRQIMDVTNGADTKKRILFGALSETALFLLVALTLCLLPAAL